MSPYRVLENPLTSTEVSEDAEAPRTSFGRPLQYKERDISRLRSLLGAFPKGVIKGIEEPYFSIARLGKKIGIPGAPEQELQQRQQQLESALEEYLPTQENYLEGALERTGKMVPLGLLGGGTPAGLAARSALAGFGGEAVKELGGGPLAQGVTEALAFSAPGLAKGIVAKASQKGLVEGARRLGMSEEAIAPLLQSEKKLKFFGPLAHKGRATQARLAKSYQETGEIFGNLAKSAEDQVPINQEAATNFLKKSHEIFMEMPTELRNKVLPDFYDLILKGKGSGKDFMNFWKDINTISKGKTTATGLLKGPIKEALESISPQLAEDFTLANNLRSKWYKITDVLAPGRADELIHAGEVGSLMYGIAKGRFDILADIMGINAARRFASGLLTKPGMQNLTLKMVHALNNNKPVVAESILSKMMEETSQD